ncbi:hypothetical protein GF339_15000 [candidate division KSB3 bacterium]|uniref:Uncharacterized protein n=1 Tax=candidate division KSB3 bacterium TaxID=2044937 RepID=A0A9D5JX26_9BACT|nr:hypothetical protein [candidate division KSB3 bacterium]MBD3325892.1 hypothetical protein [candidate division KSB3 bacterium]
MQHWGNEPHTLRVEVEGARCRLSIDQFVSKWDTSRQSIGGTRQLVLMLGNRVERHSHQQAITKFRRLKITYM